MTPYQQRHLLELFTDCSQGVLTGTKHEELQAILRTDVDARRLWFLHHDLELGLKYLSRVPAGLPDDASHYSISSKRSKLSFGTCSSTSRRRLVPSFLRCTAKSADRGCDLVVPVRNCDDRCLRLETIVSRE